MFGVGNRARSSSLDVEMIDTEIIESGVRIGAYIERALCACGFDVPDVHVAEMR